MAHEDSDDVIAAFEQQCGRRAELSTPPLIASTTRFMQVTLNAVFVQSLYFKQPELFRKRIDANGLIGKIQLNVAGRMRWRPEMQ